MTNIIVRYKIFLSSPQKEKLFNKTSSVLMKHQFVNNDNMKPSNSLKNIKMIKEREERPDKKQ